MWNIMTIKSMVKKVYLKITGKVGHLKKKCENETYLVW